MKVPNASKTRRRARIRCTQRGFGVLLLIALVAATGVAAAVFTFSRTDVVAAKAEQKTSDVLAQVKTALIGYAVRRGGQTGTARPGELPCPDTNDDGVEETTCAAGALGRVPWKTLGIPDPKDAAGETLWYAIAGPFRTRAAGNSSWLNSDTRGTLDVRAPDGTTDLTTEAVAVIFAPGAALGTQNRASGTASCPTTGTTIARRLCAANYLETAAGNNNAVTNGPYIAGLPSVTYNDRVAYLLTSELMPAVETRVGSELKKKLEDYRAATEAPGRCKCYPWADTWEYSGGIADTGQNRGRFPSEPAPHTWTELGIPLPEWVAANDWHNLVWYSVSKDYGEKTALGVSMCRTCAAPTLTVGSQPVKALLFMPGTPPGTVNRASSANRDTLSLFLEDPQNYDAADTTLCPQTTETGPTTTAGPVLFAAPVCDQYVIPSSERPDRDRIFIVADSAPSTCAANALTLLSYAPCHLTGNKAKTQCAAAAQNLSSCGCAGAATVMINEPCRNTSTPLECQAAITQLLVCTL